MLSFFANDTRRGAGPTRPPPAGEQTCPWPQQTCRRWTAAHTWAHTAPRAEQPRKSATSCHTSAGTPAAGILGWGRRGGGVRMGAGQRSRPPEGPKLQGLADPRPPCLGPGVSRRTRKMQLEKIRKIRPRTKRSLFQVQRRQIIGGIQSKAVQADIFDWLNNNSKQ